MQANAQTMKSVFITGHTGGLGQGLMEEFLEADWRVFAIARGTAEGSRRLRQGRCDLANLDTIQSALEDLLGEVTGLDLVVLNAAILGHIQPLAHTSVGELQRSWISTSGPTS